MSKSRSKKKLGLGFLGVFMLVMAFCIPTAAGVVEGDGEYEIYPTPHLAEYAGTATTTLTSQVDVTCGSAIDQYTKNRITDTLDVLGLKESTAPAAANTKLIVDVYSEGSYDSQLGTAEFFEGTFEELDSAKRYDKYILQISNGTITILGEDTDAAYMGMTTLKRIFEQLEDKTVRDLLVKDFAEVEYRGFIEGYYGNPWSYEDRADLMTFGGEIKLNQYVFASKDDPYHRTNWRALYPHEGDEGAGKDTIERIAEMAQAGNESKCFYVYALHPFYSDKMSMANYDKDLADLKAKFGQVIEAGVRQIAILEDDGSAHSSWDQAADLIVKLLNDVTVWLEELKATQYPDLKTDVLFCPGFMAYANGMSDSSNDDVKKIMKIHAGVGENVRIVMTGGKIWGDVTTAFADRFYNKVAEENGTGRYPYLWVNWPCSDNTHDSLVMGGHNSILKPNLDGYKYHGIILNPMQDSEPSKVGIFTAADFCWNVWDGETADAQQQGDQAWEDSFKYIDHMTAIETKSSKALRDISQHMITQSDTQANNTGAKFEESLNIKEDLQSFQTKLNTTPNELTKKEFDQIRQDFKKITDDVAFYLEEGTNRRIASQLTPYARSLSDTAQSGYYLMDALEAIASGDSTGVYANFAMAQEYYEKSKEHTFLELGSELHAKGGRRYIIPFTETVLAYVSEAAKEFVNPENSGGGAYRVREITYTSGKTEYGSNTKDKMIDGDDDTYLWFGQQAAVGDYIQVDLGEAKPVGVVRILVGNNAKGNNKWNTYHLTYSTNGTDWESLDSYTGNESSMDIYSVDLKGASARYLRLVNDAAVAQWVMFSEFTVYPYDDIVYTNVEDAEWEAESGVDRYELKAAQNASLQAGEYVGLKLDRIHEISNITVTGSNTADLVLETSINGKEWTTDKKGNARYIRLINKSTGEITFNLDSFVVTTNEVKAMDFESASKAPVEVYKDSDARNMGTTQNWVDGNKATKAKYCFEANNGDYVIYDLGQEINIRSMKIWVGVNDTDYPRKAKVQGTLDLNSEEWTDIFEITGDASNDTFSTTAVSNGWTPGEGAIDVNYAYQGTSEDFTPVKARYIRLYFETRNAGRYVELSEIEINDNEYLPQINDPTFELSENVVLQRGFEPQNLNDGDITTAFQPDGTENGSLIYYLSDEKEISRINILQSGSAISNAVVSVCTGKDTWTEIGTLAESYSAFYVKDLEDIYAIKLEWKNVVPMIYEIIVLENTGADMADFLEKDVQKVKTELDSADAELKEAKAELAKVQEEVKKAQDKVNAASNEEEKLKAEVELQNLYAKQSAAEAVVAEKEALKLEAASVVSQATVRKLLAMIDAASDADKQGLKDQLQAEEKAVTDSKTQAEAKRTEAANKKAEQKTYEQNAAKKNAELNNLQNITTFTVDSLNYKVINASAKTVTVTGPTDKKKVKTVNIAPTVSYSNITWNVTEISANAFKGCKNLKKVTIGSNVTKIGNQAFASCKKLKTINMKKAAKITSFGSKAFKGINSKAKITVPKKQLKAYKKKLKKTKLPKTASIK